MIGILENKIGVLNNWRCLNVRVERFDRRDWVATALATPHSFALRGAAFISFVAEKWRQVLRPRGTVGIRVINSRLRSLMGTRSEVGADNSGTVCISVRLRQMAWTGSISLNWPHKLDLLRLLDFHFKVSEYCPWLLVTVKDKFQVWFAFWSYVYLAYGHVLYILDLPEIHFIMVSVWSARDEALGHGRSVDCFPRVTDL